ncbi:unnamed protein product [Arctia plantaginis]|uniref:Uncharacterized protein n=1 Tax=Arctia plantaginis TaxID=874455 RepID=A0A8S1ACP6_ARCPL|nr:unnamed protein product [Arctia plantaginis]
MSHVFVVTHSHMFIVTGGFNGNGQKRARDRTPCCHAAMHISLETFWRLRRSYWWDLKPDKREEKSHEVLQMDPDEKLSSSAQTNGSKNNKSKSTGSKVALQSSEEKEIQEDTDTEDRKKLKNPEEILEEDKEESDPGLKADNQEGMVFLLQVPTKFRGKMPLIFNSKDKLSHWKKWLTEIAAGDNSEISGTNPRIYQPDEHPAFSRGFRGQHYKYNPELLKFISIDVHIEI